MSSLDHVWGSRQNAANNRLGAFGRETMDNDKLKDTRPFDIENAKAGAPYACRNGTEATIVKFDGRNSTYPLIGYFGEIDTASAWHADGMHLERPTDFDLVMTPLGYIEGKPVFVGDEIELKCLPMPLQWKRVKAEPTWAGTWNDECARWPTPAKVYPETRMTGDELWSIYNAGNEGILPGMVRAANAALRHAIDSGQVKITEDVDAAIDALMKLRVNDKASRAARDMAIAEAVEAEAQRIINLRRDAPRPTLMLDLAAIIAGVES